MKLSKEDLKFLLLIAIYCTFIISINVLKLDPLLLTSACLVLIPLTGIFFKDTLFKIKNDFQDHAHLNQHEEMTEKLREQIKLNLSGMIINKIDKIFEQFLDGKISLEQYRQKLSDLYETMSDNELIAVISKIDNPRALDNICETAFQKKNENIILAVLDSPHFDPGRAFIMLAVEDLNSMIYPLLAHPSINRAITGIIGQLLIETVLRNIPSHPWTKTLLLSKMHDSDYYVSMFKQSLCLYIFILDHPSQKTLEERNAIENNFLMIVNSGTYKHINHINHSNIRFACTIFLDILHIGGSFIRYHSKIQYTIRHFLDLGAKLNLIDPDEGLTYLAYCEKYVPMIFKQINQIQFEYARDSRWQKLLDMGVLTKDVDLYIYELVSQNPQLIVENQTLKTLFCQILSQENRPHIDSIWEAYHDNIVQHPLTHIIQNFLEKRPSEMTQFNAPNANIMQDPLSFTAGYCHYFGKDVLFFLDNNLDERKSLLTTKLYQSEVKPNLLPPSINHSLFSQLCQNKNASDLGQRRFDQRYGLMTQLPGRKG